MLSVTRKQALTVALTEGRGAFLVLIALLAGFWAPALWGGKLLIHGDSGHHGLTLLWVLREALAGHDALLWSSRIFGGHPLFAESQGGFVSPLNLLAVALFEPVRALGVAHALSMAVGGGGVYCLCLVLGIGRWAATFAGIAVVFSAPWVANQHNLPMSMTQAWMPWLIVAAEHWLKRPTAARGALMSCAVALMVFGGYAQLAQAAVLYVLATLLVLPCRREGRRFLAVHARALLGTGLFAVALAIALSAIQILPMFELVGVSKRSAGIGAYANSGSDLGYYFKGLLYFYLGEDPDGVSFFNLASIPTMLLAGLLLLMRMPPRIGGHLLAAFLLFNLGVGYVSPLFSFIYDHHLIPGLHYFRSTYSYIPASLIGLAVAGAAVLDRLGRAEQIPWRGWLQRHTAWPMAALAVYGIGAAYVCAALYASVYSKGCFIAPALLALAGLSLGLRGQRRWLPVCAVLILAGDAMLLHTREMVFHDRALVDRPADSVRAILAEPDHADYRVMDVSPWGALVFWPSTTPEMASGYRRLLAALNTFPTALQWRVSSINGSLALPLARRELIDPIFDAELKGASPARPGLRMLDILGIRYIASADPLATPALTPFWENLPQIVRVYRNPAARPRFQLYWKAQSVDTPEQALTALQAAQEETLLLEKSAGADETPDATPSCPACAPPRLEVVEARAMRYRVNIDVDRAAWLFLADANYPGWQATVDGVRQPVRTAQVLGKAVRLHAGRNVVTIRYVPWSFYIGAIVSGIALLLALFILLRAHGACRRKAAPSGA